LIEMEKESQRRPDQEANRGVEDESIFGFVDNLSVRANHKAENSSA
jgi:hypothetical protein